MLNKNLYTTNSQDAFSYFKENAEDFKTYHDGLELQLDKWPKNPADIFIAELKFKQYKDKTIADLGCGEGELELVLKEKNPEVKIYSYDIGKINDHVIQADISNLPKHANSADVGVFSLSLMSTNYIQHLLEANRVFSDGGLLFIAEVSSRLEIQKFSELLRKLGFKNKKLVKLKHTLMSGYSKKLEILKKEKKKITKHIKGELYLKVGKYKKR